MSQPDERAALLQRVLAFQRSSLAGAPSEPFNTLALDLHRFQVAHAPVVAALTERPAHSWRQIPCVPISLYKDLPVGTVGPDEPAKTFLTSGTTGGGRGAHRMRCTTAYDAGALAWAATCVPSPPRHIIALLHDPHHTPESSLSHMVALFSRWADAVDTPAPTWHLRDGRLHLASLVDALRTARAPVFCAATAFALADALDHPLPPLPPGSVLMVTGGFKGHAVTLSDDALYAKAQAALRPARLVTEYGMTELSSQLWGSPGQPYRAPPWLRVRAVHPATGQDVPTGEPGQLCFYDLANLDASVGVETLDLGALHDDGSLTLLGRIEGAEPRGCSLTVEEAWGRP